MPTVKFNIDHIKLKNQIETWLIYDIIYLENLPIVYH